MRRIGAIAKRNSIFYELELHTPVAPNKRCRPFEKEDTSKLFGSLAVPVVLCKHDVQPGP